MYCLLTIDDKVFGMGFNKYGVLGLGHRKEVKEVEIITELCDKSVKQFFNGTEFVLGLTSDNKLFSWGINDHGQLGFGHFPDFKTFSPQLIEYFNNKNIVQVCCGYYHSSVLTSDGRVYLWGNYDEEIIDHPIECELVDEIKSIHCSSNQTFCLTQSGNVYYVRLKLFKVIDTINNIQFISSSYRFIYLIALNSLIYI